jgi:hypothetical protein
MAAACKPLLASACLALEIGEDLTRRIVAGNARHRAAEMPYPVLLGLENCTWFPDTACLAIIWAAVGSHLGNVG